MASDAKDMTALLTRMMAGDPGATSELWELIYPELRSLAQREFQGQRNDHTLQPTALVNEAFMRLARHRPVEWHGRRHFFAVAAVAMRQILINHAKGRAAAKRGGGRQKFTYREGPAPGQECVLDLLALDEALAELAQLDQRKAALVELRFFGGLTVDDAAEALRISKATAENDWRFARAWLLTRLSGEV
jgi:RNA polymerase sigma-70 factor (ECF subfamily)